MGSLALASSKPFTRAANQTFGRCNPVLLGDNVKDIADQLRQPRGETNGIGATGA